MEIETQRLVIRSFKKMDLQAVHEYASQGEILIYEPWGPNSVEDTKAFIDHSLAFEKENPQRTFEFAVCLKENGNLIGGCGLKYLTQDPEKLNLGYIINPKYWNQGFATEAAKGLIKFACNDLKSYGIVATCDEFNLASQKVLEKCGMKKIKASPRSLKLKQRTSRTFHYKYRHNEVV